MVMDSYILIGGGEHARVVLDTLLTCGVGVKALFDPKHTGELFGVPQMGEYRGTAFPSSKAIVAIGNNATRKKVVESISHPFGSVVHPSAVVSNFSHVQAGSMILHGAILQAQVRVGNHVVVNTGSQVDHDCELGDFVHIAPGAVLCGNVKVGEGTLIGAAATVIPGIRIGKWAIVGAGTVVTKDVPDYAVVVGVPSRVVKILSHQP